jgi:hypothetical protein
MKPVNPAITEEMLRAYETVRASGVTNMFDLPVVCFASGLSRGEVLAIMKNYRALTERYPNVRKR